MKIIHRRTYHKNHKNLPGIRNVGELFLKLTGQVINTYILDYYYIFTIRRQFCETCPKITN